MPNDRNTRLGTYKLDWLEIMSLKINYVNVEFSKTWNVYQGKGDSILYFSDIINIVINWYKKTKYDKIIKIIRDYWKFNKSNRIWPYIISLVIKNKEGNCIEIEFYVVGEKYPKYVYIKRLDNWHIKDRINQTDWDYLLLRLRKKFKFDGSDTVKIINKNNSKETEKTWILREKIYKYDWYDKDWFDKYWYDSYWYDTNLIKKNGISLWETLWIGDWHPFIVLVKERWSKLWHLSTCGKCKWMLAKQINSHYDKYSYKNYQYQDNTLDKNDRIYIKAINQILEWIEENKLPLHAHILYRILDWIRLIWITKTLTISKKDLAFNRELKEKYYNDNTLWDDFMDEKYFYNHKRVLEFYLNHYSII